MRKQSPETKGAKQHYLPAALIGRFTSRPAERLRHSPIWVRRRGTGAPFQQKAEQVAWARDFYSVADVNEAEDPTSSGVDFVWSKVEARLPEALSELEATGGPLGAHIFGEVLVPFAAQCFVRGIDFPERFRVRWSPLTKGASPAEGEEVDEHRLSTSNVNLARLMELQRLLSPMLRAHWRVLHTGEQTPFATSNLGFAPFGLEGVEGAIIPIGRSCAVHLQPRLRTPRLAIEAGDRWLVDVEALTVSARLTRRINHQMARFAPDEIYGDPDAVVIACEGEMRRDEAAPLPHPVWDHPTILRRNEHELLRFLQLIATPPGKRRLTEDEAWSVINYPAPIYFNATGEIGLTTEEDAEIVRIQENEAARESRRLSALLGQPHAGVRTIDPVRRP